MPTNLPAECYDLEERYKAATTAEEKIAWLEELISAIPKHKGTDKLRANYRKRLSKLKEGVQSGRGGNKQVSAFHIDREGAGQVAVVGCPNVGKSALVTALSNASPEVALSPYTTWTPTPGMMEWQHVQIQLIDTPPLNKDYVDPELINLLRRVDLLALVLDIQSFPLEHLEDALELLAAHRILPASRRESTPPQRGLTFAPIQVVVNKCDDPAFDEEFEALNELLGADWPLLAVSATTGRNLDMFRQQVFERLKVIRVFSKPPGRDYDPTSPFVLTRGGTVEEFAGKVHKDFLEQLKSARVWGQGVYDGQLVGRDHVLHDGDVVELRI